VSQKLEYGEIQKQTFDRYTTDFHRFFDGSEIVKKDIRKITEAELQYIIMSYEKVTDEFWLEKGASEISIGEEQFYEDSGNFYIKEFFEDNPVNYHILVSTGKYIVNLVQKGSDNSDKNDIFASWGVKDFEPGSTKDLDLDIFDGFRGGNAAKSHSYSVDELADVSKEQKIEIVFQNPEATYMMTELEGIAEFYNQIKRDTWTEIGQIPDEKNDICLSVCEDKANY